MKEYPVPENFVLRAAARTKSPRPAGQLAHLTFEPGQHLWSVGETQPHAFFPLRGVVSLQLSPSAGKQVEIAVVGREGYSGVALIPAADRTRASAVAITAGEAFVMTAAVYRRYLAIPAFRTATERYTQLFTTILSRILVCSRVHPIEKICVGRLLLIQDRTRSDSMQLTQEAFAHQLGVRRASINRVVTGLQKAGAISYDRRGRLTIRDRELLERRACSCYHTIKSEYDRLVTVQGVFQPPLLQHRK